LRLPGAGNEKATAVSSPSTPFTGVFAADKGTDDLYDLSSIVNVSLTSGARGLFYLLYSRPATSQHRAPRRGQGGGAVKETFPISAFKEVR